MSHLLLALTAMAALLCWGVGPLFAAAAVRDEASLFTPETVQRAVQEIEDIQRQHGLAVRVETVKTYPADQVRPPTFFGPQVPPDAFFTKWAEERAGDADLFLFICLEPVRIRVVVKLGWKDAFPPKAATGLRKQLEQAFSRRTPNFDQGLLDGLAFTRHTLDSNRRPEGQRQVGWTAIIGLIGCLLFVWLVLSLLRGSPKPALQEASPE